MNGFPPIADYAFLSDCEVSCLIAADSGVEWLCLPRPDGPSIFGAMLDRRAGYFRFAPDGTRIPHDRRYVPGTMVMETTWHTPAGWLVVKDALVLGPAPMDTRRSDYRRTPAETVASGILLRTATCIDGHVEVVVDCLPIFDYGRVGNTMEYVGDGYGQLSVRPPRRGPPTFGVQQHAAGRRRAAVLRRATLARGNSAFVALTWGETTLSSFEEAAEALAATEQSWRDWSSTANVPDHRWRPYIERTRSRQGPRYAPTGAIMAAGTTSLPETPGGERNWDYRYTWVRDCRSCSGRCTGSGSSGRRSTSSPS